MPSAWCHVCCTNHPGEARCPGELRATGPERHGWRVNVQTPRGMEAYGVLIAESSDLWRARILTYPKILWLVPGGAGTIKFVGRTPQQAERRAIEFIRAHCNRQGYRMRQDLVEAQPGRVDVEIEPDAIPRPTSAPARRKIRFLPLRFGVARASERAGTGNLSETGMFIITDAPVDSGKRLNMLLECDGDSVPLEGLVRWMRRRHHVGRSPGMGVQLLAPPPVYVDFVRSLQ